MNLSDLFQQTAIIPQQLYEWLLADVNSHEHTAEHQQMLKQHIQQLQVQLAESPQLQPLKRSFQLTGLALMILLLAVLPSVYPRYRVIYQKLHGQPEPTIDLLISMICDTEQTHHTYLSQLWDNSPLFHWRLLTVQGRGAAKLYQPLWVAHDLLQWFLARLNQLNELHQLPPEILPPEIQELLTPLKKPPWPVVDTFNRDRKTFGIHEKLTTYQTSQILVINGGQGAGKRTSAISLAKQLAQPIYELNQAVFTQYQEFHSVLIDCLRYLNLTNGILYWPNGAAYLAENKAAVPLIANWLNQAPRLLIFGELTHNPLENTAINSIALPMALTPYFNDQLTVDVFQPAVQAQLWQTFVSYQYEQHGINRVAMSEDEWLTLAHRFPSLPGHIMQLSHRVMEEDFTENQCSQNSQNDLDPDIMPENIIDRLMSLATQNQPEQLAGVATRMVSNIGLQDCFVEKGIQQQLHSIIHQFEYNLAQIREQPSTRITGLKVLLYGPPGTGKTHCAQALANELQIPLYRVDLAKIASKWIGETEKNLAAVFNQAEQQPCVLFFDEADSLFTRRTAVQDAQDKNTNLGVNYLLQRIEQFNGLLLLATNYQDNIDPAFFRRLDWVIQLNLPNVKIREKLWQYHWPKAITKINAICLKELALLFPLTGAQISNITQAVKRQLLTDKMMVNQTNPPIIDKALLAHHINIELQKQTENKAAIYQLNHWLRNGENHGNASSNC
ncbi:ATP-binding protein [Endozoicomonas sp. SM1973]|uniref:ATP-binding protein n=1 Tax=Spartinivicinus marinus TaxID=2994442 RepID=A0A853I8L1_9GAMM|nr:ATP-binding protein [Spartinivicinus marinus]MCX4029631.1 ATP-binding protein [Spartinivicinus marinus]NYZ66988.1 ATP-binding protein [Spartinivicinus marinus]